jgi:hypothetical protein
MVENRLGFTLFHSRSFTFYRSRKANYVRYFCPTTNPLSLAIDHVVVNRALFELSA